MKENRNRLTGAAIFLLAVAWSQGSQAVISVDRTRIIMNSNEKSVSLILNNDDKHLPFLAQSWVTDAGGTRTDALMALPPLQRIDAGQKSQVRITQVRSITDRLPKDRETLFWFSVRSIPPKPDATNVLQLTIQSQLKLFYRPAAIVRGDNDQPEKKLVVERSGGHLTLKNPTPYYVTVIWLGTDRSHRLSGFGDGEMVSPFSSLPLKATLSAKARKLWVGYIDDYGGLQMNPYSCDALSCALKGGTS
ncbi:fimbria/pilus periplasmic chaperone [Salmonella enterica]|uniref:Fimbrial chaperone protein StdC n=2 Tax=Salmonella enterica I TaxID=59201 RepID=A0A5Y0S5L2_SALNE|nr:fimbria/pilus periplasmic chaperone [Salmonella enterica]EAA2594408.1 fimbrial chaperone protein StdC [Salmonella enterica subsp. enterica serovar Poona]EBR7997271.1 fimbrial chaperone protein StdC [Salmonella enterica subsp. enterica serovar Panama]EBS4088969.1 fimbrial chaperone protein StdC [Salmonella enterica subsp. enterica serovar Newport]ECC9940550.1 fimbrial chaperone protein StdC [Salmonella enterica subsp. enterica]ECD7245111.1 fimbrial chaperone protein StdC [Salmonella enterica